MNEEDPLRIADDPDAVGRLAELVRASREDVASSAEMSQLESKLAAVLWPGGPAAGGATGTSGGSAGGAASSSGSAAATAGATAAVVAKVGGLMLLSALLAGGAYFVSQRAEGPEPPTAPAVGTDTPEPTPAPPEAPRQELAPAPEVPEAPPESEAEPSAPRRSTGPAAPRPPQDLLASEARLLDAARKAMVKDPRRALGLVEAHRQRFPAGALSQEREVLGIEALKRLGKTADAEQRAERFRGRFPNSAYDRKIDGVLEQK